MRKTLAILALLLAVLGTRADNCRESRISTLEVSDFYASQGAGLMTVTMVVDLGQLKLPSNQQMILTPVLEGPAGEQAELRRIVLNGRKAQLQYERGNTRGLSKTDIVEQRLNKQPQTVTYTDAVAYEPWMELSTIYLREVDCGCGKQAPGGEIALGQPLPTNAIEVIPEYIWLTPEATVKVYEDSARSYIDFVVDKFELNPTYHRNPIEFERIRESIQRVIDDPNMTINMITIHGYASPESPYEHNTYLAENRARVIKEYVGNMMQIPAEKMSSTYTPEDWEGLREYLRKNDLGLAHADEIMAMSYDERFDWDQKEWRIKSTYPDEYKQMLAEWYPYLRHTDYKITYTVRGFSVDEAKEMLKTKPYLLSLNEFYLVAMTYEPGSDEFNNVMDIALMLNPDDALLNTNAANNYLIAGKLDKAASALEKAGDSPAALNARGILAYRLGDLDAARQFFIASSSPQAYENLLLLFPE